MRRIYKDFPTDEPDPITNESTVPWPVLRVRVGYGHTQSPRFDAVVDSGSPWCLFRGDVGAIIGIKDITKGRKYALGGVIAGTREPAYFHKVKIYIEADWVIECMAGFCQKLGVTGILGRSGFFDSFRVSFDHSGIDPALEIERVLRA
jgi:hypothetical protein